MPNRLVNEYRIFIISQVLYTTGGHMITHPATSSARVFDFHPLLMVFGLAILISVYSLTSPLDPAQAAPPITPSGLNTQISQPITLPSGQTQYNIMGGTRPGGGANLFHSFGQFNVPTNNIANFFNESALPTSNILGRVTGGNVSSIFGMIQTQGFEGANLFLMNPAGFLFGPNATLNVGGMVAFTTADYLRLQGASTDIFYADPAKPSILTAAPVAAFGFLGPNAASIIVQGSTLQVAEGKSLSLIGGNRTFEMATETETGEFVPSGVTSPSGVVVSGGILSAPSGQIHLVSVASAGEVTIPTQGEPGPGVGSFPTLGRVELSNGAWLNASTATDIDGIPISTNGGGTVSIRAGEFVMRASTITANTLSSGNGATTAVSIESRGDVTVSDASTIFSHSCFAFPCGTGRTGDIQISGQTVVIENGSLIATATATDVPTVTPETTNPVGGNITIAANDVRVLAGAIIQTESSGLGDGGKISIVGTESVKVAGFDPLFGTESTIITSDAGGMGKGGAIEIWAPKIAIEDLGSLVTASGVRRSGALSLRVDELTISRGGRIVSQGGDLSIQGLSASASNDVVLSGLGEGARESQINMVGGGIGGGEDSGAGTLSIHTTRLLLTDDARINSEANTLSGGLTSIVASESVTVEQGAKIRVGGGNGGSLEITAPTILLDGGSLQTTSGPALVSGPVTVNTTNLTLQNGGQINSGESAFAGPTEGGGGVTIRGVQGQGSSADAILITGHDSAGNVSGINSATSGTLPGGDINVSALTVTLQDGGTLNSTTAGIIPEATGGNITVTANQGVQLTSGSSIAASSSGPANAGNIVINAGNQLTMTNSAITTQATAPETDASGGNITVTAAELVWLTNSQLNASVQGSSTTVGGNIIIDPQSVVLQNSHILAQATQGNGGNITITTNLFLPDATSTVSASSQFGQQGTVLIQSPVSPASGKIMPLGKSPLLSTAMFNQRCTALAEGTFSSFTVAGRETLPSEPGSWLSSPLALQTMSEDKLQQASNEQETPLLSLRQIAPIGFLTQGFAVESSGCSS